jgi:hypothetical protein
MSFYQGQGSPNLLICQAIIVRQGDPGLKPKLRLTIRALHVNVHPWLFAREEKEPKTAVAEDRGTHGTEITSLLSCGVLTTTLSRAGGSAATEDKRRFQRAVRSHR